MKRESPSDGQDPRRGPADCSTAMEVLRNSWLDLPLPAEDTGGPAERPDGDLRIAMDHLGTCDRCRKEASDFHRVSGDLLAGFSALVRMVDLPTREKMDEIIRKAREEAPEAVLLRRLRRTLRVMLWGAFYAFTLLACSALAVALYKALKAL